MANTVNIVTKLYLTDSRDKDFIYVKKVYVRNPEYPTESFDDYYERSVAYFRIHNCLPDKEMETETHPEKYIAKYWIAIAHRADYPLLDKTIDQEAWDKLRDGKFYTEEPEPDLYPYWED